MDTDAEPLVGGEPFSMPSNSHLLQEQCRLHPDDEVLLAMWADALAEEDKPDAAAKVRMLIDVQQDIREEDELPPSNGRNFVIDPKKVHRRSKLRFQLGLMKVVQGMMVHYDSSDGTIYPTEHWSGAIGVVAADNGDGTVGVSIINPNYFNNLRMLYYMPMPLTPEVW